LKTCVDEEWASFLGFLDASGSLFGKFPSAGAKGSAEARTRKMDRRAEHWLRWHRAVPNRLLLAIHRIRLRALLVDAREALVTGVAQHAVIDLVRRWKVTSQAFRGLAEKCDEIFSGPVGDPPGPGLSVEIQGWLDEGIELLEEQWVGPMRSGQFQASVHELADGISTKLASSLADLPDAISVSAPQTVKNGSVDPLIEDRTVTIRASARQVLDVMRLEGIRKLPGPILEVLAGAREGTDALVEVLRFNLEAAMEEVAGSATEDPGTHLEEARSMTREGILRTDEAIPRLLLGLRGGWEGFSRATDDLFSGALEDMDARLSSEGGVQEQIVGVQEKLGHTVRMGTQQIRQTVQQTTRSLRRTARKATIAFLRAIRLGREAVGAAPQEAAQGDRALAVIRLAPTILSDLPLIYRRLFSFEPLTEEVLLKGRTVERAWVQSRFEAWRNGVGGPVILSGPVGAGHTSFFNVLATSLFSEVRTHRVELDRRFRSEESVAASIGQAVGLQEGAVTSFSDLAKALERASSPRRPMVVFTERLEHVFLRTPGGSDLFEDVLSFQAQTSERVFWVSSMSGAAWKLVAKTEPRAASLAHVHPLNPPSRNELEELILARHRRSGLPLEFRPPPDLNPLARRRLRLSHGEKAQQRILQGQYFDRLHRASQESIPMAILHWLRSTDFRSNEGTLFLTPPAEIRYGFLDGLDLDLDFALKAFLEHASLTLEEYREVFAATEDQSFQTFEALRARLLLAPAEAAGAVLPTPGSTVEEGVRYRIPALLSQIVARRLKDRNILH